MKLDRNIESNEGRGKYAILNLRKLASYEGGGAFEGLPVHLQTAISALENAGVLEWGAIGGADEFFLIKLKDIYSRPALLAYAHAAASDDPEWSNEVNRLAERSGRNHPLCKRPD